MKSIEMVVKTTLLASEVNTSLSGACVKKASSMHLAYHGRVGRNSKRACDGKWVEAFTVLEFWFFVSRQRTVKQIIKVSF